MKGIVQRTGPQTVLRLKVSYVVTDSSCSQVDCTSKLYLQEFLRSGVTQVSSQSRILLISLILYKLWNLQGFVWCQSLFSIVSFFSCVLLFLNRHHMSIQRRQNFKRTLCYVLENRRESISFIKEIRKGRICMGLFRRKTIKKQQERQREPESKQYDRKRVTTRYTF